MKMPFEAPAEIAKRNAELARQAAIGDKIKQLAPDRLNDVLDNVERWVKEHSEELRDPETRVRVEKLQKELETLLETTKPH